MPVRFTVKVVLAEPVGEEAELVGLVKSARTVGVRLKVEPPVSRMVTVG